MTETNYSYHLSCMLTTKLILLSSVIPDVLIDCSTFIPVPTNEIATKVNLVLAAAVNVDGQSICKLNALS